MALVCSIPKREHFFQLHFQMFSLHLGRIISTNHAKNKNIIKMTFHQKIQFNFKGHHCTTYLVDHMKKSQRNERPTSSEL